MVTPTWDELLRRNRATATKAISATVHTSGLGGWREHHVWHAPPDLWRIEDADGNPERIAGTRWYYDRSGEAMVRTDRFARRPGGASHAGGPEQLLVLHRDWPEQAPPTAELQLIDGRSATFSTPDAPEPPYRPAGDIVAAQVRGRAGWTVPCVRAANGHPITWTFDDETGVVIGRNAGGFGAIELSDVVITDHFSPAVFGFHGDYVDIAQALRDSERGWREEEEFRDTRGTGHLLHRVGDLPGEVFLDLQTTGEHVHQPCNLRQTQHFTRWNISHMRFADEGQQVMFTQRIQLDVVDNDHFIVVGGEQRAVDDFFDTLFITVTQVLHGFGRTQRCIEQAFAVGIFAEADEDLAIVLGQG